MRSCDKVMLYCGGGGGEGGGEREREGEKDRERTLIATQTKGSKQQTLFHKCNHLWERRSQVLAW